MNETQLRELARQTVEWAKASNKDGRFNPEKYQDCKLALDSLRTSWDDYSELLALLNSEVPKEHKVRATQAYLRRVSTNAQCLHVGVAAMLSTVKVAHEVAATTPDKAVGVPILPDVEHTFQELLSLKEKWGSCIEFGAGSIKLLWPEIKVVRFDKIKKTWKNLHCWIDLVSWVVRLEIPGAPKSPLGHACQVHPHILADGGLCTQGDSAVWVAQARKEARVFDLVEQIYQLMIEPYESVPHTGDIVGLPDTELLCDKCKTWRLWPDKGTKQNKLVTKVVAGVTMVVDSRFVCDNCLPKCPETGLVVMPGSGFVYEGKEYHANCAVRFQGQAYPKSVCVLDYSTTAWVPKSKCGTCLLTGLTGLAKEAPAKYDGAHSQVASPTQLIKLKDGRCVVAGCLDLVDEKGHFEGVSREGNQKRPWWIGRLDNSGWSQPGTAWHSRIKSRIAAAQDRAKADQGDKPGLLADRVV